MRGRKPKTEGQRNLDGNPGRRAGRNNPAVAPGAPTCPRWLGPAARAEWRRVAPELVRAGLLAKLDMAVLAAYCSAWERYQKATKVVAKEGLTICNEKGVAKRHPAVAIAADAERQLRLLAGELGLTHLSRQRMDVGDTGDEKDPFEILLNGAGTQN